MAAYFGKEHRHVLRDIDNLIASAPELSGRQFSDEGGLPNSGHIPETPKFGESSYLNPQNGQAYPSFEMTRDGFTLLAMGFTGSKALKWKLRYIEAFNAMEAENGGRPVQARGDHNAAREDRTTIRFRRSEQRGQPFPTVSQLALADLKGCSTGQRSS